MERVLMLGVELSRVAQVYMPRFKTHVHVLTNLSAATLTLSSLYAGIRGLMLILDEEFDISHSRKETFVLKQRQNFIDEK
ncbi:hypothetical protein SUGI_0856070 [Cryptomeria japonica]|nr:hypothetical protein SUGI_0856070 [Cryptomeria japonica]